MPESNWRRNYTIGLIVAGLFAALAATWIWKSATDSEAAIQQATSRQTEQQADAADVIIEGRCLALPTAEQQSCISQERQAAREGQRNEHDLEAQQTMAVWTRAMGIAAVIGIGVGIFGLGLIFTTFRETRKAADAGLTANEIARDTARRQLRAYVTAEDHKLTGFFRNGPSLMHTKIWNRGQTPAYDVRVISIITGTQDADPTTVKVRFIKLDGFLQSSAVLGPGQWFEHINDCQRPLDDAAYTAVMTGEVAFVFAGVISYRDAFGRRHFTTFKYFYRGSGDYITQMFDLEACGKGNVAS